MKAVALISPGEVKQIDINEPVLDDEYGAILKPIIVTPCTSDVHTIFHGGSPKRKNLVLGHESVCQILQIGKKVRDFNVGEIVAVPAITPTWTSLDIQYGNICHADSPFSGHKLGRSIDGVFEEKLYFPMADLNLAKIPNNVSLEQALMAIDVASTGFTAVAEGGVTFGDNVVIFGIGAIGLMAIVAARLSGAARIIAVGGRKLSFDLAKEYGATDLVNYRESVNVVDDIKKLNIPIDKVIICGGNDNTMRQAYDIVRYGTGIISNVNYFVGIDDIPIPKFSGGKGMCGKTLKLSLSRGGRIWIEKILNLIALDRFDPSKLITTKLYGFDNIIPAIYKMKDEKEKNLKIAVYL